MTKMIKGCGKEMTGDAGGFVCGDSIDTDYDNETGTQYVQPIYCKDCWDKVKAMDLVGGLEE